jgi:lysozyme family protein
MANFYKAHKKTSASEGGYANDKDDPGKETYCGISRRYWPRWIGWRYVDGWKKTLGGKVPNNYKFKDPTLNKLIKEFYFKYFWKKLRLDSIENQSIAESIYDYAVNVGKKPAVRRIQWLVYFYLKTKLKCDGIIGPKTIAAINKTCRDYPDLPNAFIRVRIGDYFTKCKSKPIKYKWLRGWVARSMKSLEK